MGGFYVDKYNTLYREIHWACKTCVVRPICNRRCDKLSINHWLCEHCKRRCLDCEFPCKKVERAQLFESVDYYYGDKLRNIMTEQMEQTSIFKLLQRPSKQL